ncbi:MAG: hypothetical protein ACJ788_11460, partial [Ktedonobacteraceae bacterium]
LQADIEPKLEREDGKTQVENSSPATSGWLYSNDELPTQKEIAIAPSTVAMAERELPPLSKQVSTSLPPGHRPALQQSQPTLKRLWLVIASSFLIVIVIISSLLYAALQGSFSPKANSQLTVSKNAQSTPMPTTRSSLTLSPTPTPKHAQVPIQAVQITPTLTLTSSPSTSPTPSPSPTPTPTSGLSATPASLPTDTACSRMGNKYVCAITLQLSPNHSGNVKWSTYRNGISASFSPSKGMLSPGQQQTVLSTITTNCPATGSLVFTSGVGSVSVSWNC